MIVLAYLHPDVRPDRLCASCCRLGTDVVAQFSDGVTSTFHHLCSRCAEAHEELTAPERRAA